jgi:hypothetical protein
MRKHALPAFGMVHRAGEGSYASSIGRLQPRDRLRHVHTLNSRHDIQPGDQILRDPRFVGGNLTVST